MNSDDAEDSLVRALMEPLPKTGYLTEAVRHMTGHARHRLPESFAAACAETTEHFRAVEPPSPRGKSKLLLASLLGLAVAAAFIVPGAARRELKLLLVTQADQLPEHVFTQFGGQQVIRERILSRVSPADGEILFGDLTARKTEDRWKALAEREPTNPGRHADAALGYLKSNGKLPTGFVAKAEKLDPGNGWYAFFDRSLSDPVRRQDFDLGDIHREAAFIDKSGTFPRFEDPTFTTWQQRFTLLPEEELWCDLVTNQRFLAKEMPDPGYRFSRGASVGVLLSSLIHRLGDRAEINFNVRRFLKHFESQVAVSRTGTDVAQWLGVPEVIGTTLHARGFPSHATIFDDLQRDFSPGILAFRTNSTPTSFLAAKSSAAPSNDPALLRPGIVAEWAMHERLIGWGSVLLLGLLLLIHLAVLQSNRGFDRLAERLGQILRRSDHLLIFLISLGLPLLLYAIATRLPGHGLLTIPLAQEKDPRFTLLAILHGAWILAVPLLALEATRWRLAVRGRALGMAGRGLHLGMVPLAMLLGTLTGATVLPAIPSIWADPKLPLLGLTGGLAIGALWLLVLIVWHFAAPRESFPERLLRLRVVFWPVLAALLVTAAGMVALREHERHLVSINRFEKSPRTHAGNPTAADQEFLETWKPKLLEAVRKARADLEALE